MSIRGVVLKSRTGKLSGLVSDALGRFLVRPVPAKRLLTKAAKEKRPAETDRLGKAFLPVWCLVRKTADWKRRTDKNVCPNF
jgi:hypothetical protein